MAASVTRKRSGYAHTAPEVVSAVVAKTELTCADADLL
jgi:hypothetical protein